MTRTPYASPVERVTTKQCYQCGKGEPRFPPNRPVFCSTDCMVLYAVWTTTEQIWCNRHAAWYHLDDGCDGCTEEGRL
jgi:hypothetical protein